MSLLKDLFHLILHGKSATEILYGLSPQKKGHTGEAILRILVLLGIHPTDPSKVVIPYRVNVKGRRLEPFHTMTSRVTQLSRGLVNSGGANKIDVCWRDGDSIAVCSSKIGMVKVSAIADLEIVPMVAEFTESGGYTEGGKPVPRDTVVPYSLVPCSADVLRLAERSGASNLATRDNLNPLDIGDLDRMCCMLLAKLEQCPEKDIESVVGHLMGDEKPALDMRFHQRLISLKIKRLISSGVKTALIGALPRSGKTWIGADLSRAYKRILVITPRPTETSGQWKSVFSKHREFSGYHVDGLDAKTSDEISKICRSDIPLVAVASLQFLKMGEHPELDGLEWDIVLFDEAHAGGSTELSDDVLARYTGYSGTIRIMLTATYTKPADHYQIPAEHCCFWDLEDVRLMRRWGEADVFERLCEKYGTSDVGAVRTTMYAHGETDVRIRECYLSAPRLGIMTTTMQTEVYDDLKRMLGNDSVYGFSMRSLFMTTKDGRAFQNPSAVDRFLALMTGSNKMKDYKGGDMSMFSRIQRYWRSIGHRESNCDEFMTQLWFIPSGVGQLLDNVKGALIAKLNAHPVLKNFDTMTLDAGMDDIQTAVASAVMKARENGKKGVILLTGNVGSLGVSLPDVDVAFVLHDMESADMTYQQMLRVLTEMTEKKCGLVVDFNVWRVLTTLNAYATSRCDQGRKSSAERIHWCVSHLVDIDPDMWQCDESPAAFSRERIAEELTGQWRNMLEKSGGSLKQLSRKMVDLGDDQSQLDRIAKYMDAETGSHAEIRSEQDPLLPGIERRSMPDEDAGAQEEQEEQEEQDEKEEPIIQKANLNELLARLIPEIAILSGGKCDLLEAIQAIHSNPAQREAINQFLMELYKK